MPINVIKILNLNIYYGLFIEQCQVHSGKMIKNGGNSTSTTRETNMDNEENASVLIWFLTWPLSISIGKAVWYNAQSYPNSNATPDTCIPVSVWEHLSHQHTSPAERRRRRRWWQWQPGDGADENSWRFTHIQLQTIISLSCFCD